MPKAQGVQQQFPLKDIQPYETYLNRGCLQTFQARFQKHLH